MKAATRYAPELLLADPVLPPHCDEAWHLACRGHMKQMWPWDYDRLWPDVQPGFMR